MKRRVLIFHPYLAPYRVDCYNSLSKDFDIRVILTGGYKELSSLGFDLQVVNEQAQFDYVYYSKGLHIGRHLLSFVYYKEIKKFRPDIILAHEYGVNTIASIFLKRKYKFKIYITCDDSPIMAEHYSSKRAFLRRWVLARINGVMTVHPKVASFLQERYPQFTCRYLFFPIIQDDRVLQSKINGIKEDVILDLQKQYNLYGKKIVLFVGRLESCKSPDLLLKVFQKTTAQDVCLVMIGKGSLYKELMDMSKDDKRVIFLGMQSGSSLYAWYRMAHIFVLPSKFEPFGAVVNEALVAGCFTIVSDKVGATSLINKENGVVFQSGDEEELQSLLIQRIQNTDITKKKQSLMTKEYSEYYSHLKSFLSNED